MVWWRLFWWMFWRVALSGALFAAGWISLPLVACGALKIAYNLALWRAMRRHRVDDL